MQILGEFSARRRVFENELGAFSRANHGSIGWSFLDWVHQPRDPMISPRGSPCNPDLIWKSIICRWRASTIHHFSNGENLWAIHIWAASTASTSINPSDFVLNLWGSMEVHPLSTRREMPLVFIPWPMLRAELKVQGTEELLVDFGWLKTFDAPVWSGH